MIAAALLPLVMVLTLGHRLSGWAPLAVASHLLLAGYIVAQWPRLTRLPRFIVVVAAALLAVLPWLSAAPLAAVFDGLNQATWFATFLAALSFLRQAAAGSPLVRRCGEIIISQPPAKRYATLSGGAYLIGVLLNMAVLNLLGTMIERANTLAAAGGHAVVREVRARRMFSAVIRGFGTAPLGSPLSITLAMILSLVPSVDWRVLLPLGLATTAVLLVFGWVWDQASAPRHLSGLVATPKAPPGGWWAILRFATLVLAVFLAAVVMETVAGISLPLAILLTAPAAAFLWMVVQRRRRGVVRAVALSLARLRNGAGDQFGGMRTEVCVLAAAGLMGTLVARVVPAEAFADLLTSVGVAGLPVALLVFVLMAALPQIGLNPVLVATIILSSMSRPDIFGLTPTLLALATMSGWALAIGSAPVTTSILIASRIAGVSPRVAGWGWNWRFTLAAAGVLGGWLVILDSLLA
ncbi:hypothetical protein ACM64Y_20225 [Novispirillum sp. DQ9]|uniref:hypothetical protein n=1 Tax=Novispirillum sp. DQ9 TaxID=3398612 RepID=UPI003C7C94CB